MSKQGLQKPLIEKQQAIQLSIPRDLKANELLRSTTGLAASSFYDGFYGEDDTTLKMQDKVEEIFSDEFLTRGLYDEDQKYLKFLNCFDIFPLLFPEGKFYLIWKIFVGCIILACFFELPGYIIFGPELFYILPEGVIDFYCILVTVVFIADILLEFNTAIYYHGKVISRKSQIALAYFRGYFAFDLIATAIFSIRFLSDIDDTRWLYLLIFFKTPELMTIFDYITEKTLLMRKSRMFFRVLKILIFLFLIINIYSTIFYKIGAICAAVPVECKDNAKSCDNDFTQQTNVNCNQDHSWLTKPSNFGIINQFSLNKQYFLAFYYAVGTLTSTMGYGDLQPQNVYEVSYSLCGVMFGIMFFIYNINMIYDIIKEYGEHQETVMKKLFLFSQLVRDKIAIMRFMRDKSISDRTKSRVNKYLSEFFQEEGARQFEAEQKIIDQLGPELRLQLLFFQYFRTQLLYEAYGQFLKQITLFNMFSREFLRSLSQKVQEVRLSMTEKIIKDKITQDNDEAVDHCLYYIVKGSVVIHPNIIKDSEIIVLKELKEGECFGEYSFFTGISEITTVGFIDSFFRLDRNDFIELIKLFPEDFEVFCMLRDQKMFSQKLEIEDQPEIIVQTCYTCEQPGHVSSQCPFTHYVPNLDFAKSMNSKQKRVVLKRKDQRQIKALQIHYKLERYQQDIVKNYKKHIESLLKAIQPLGSGDDFSLRDSMTESQAVELQEEKKEENLQKSTQKRSLKEMLMKAVKMSKNKQPIYESFVIDEPQNYSFYFPNQNIDSIVENNQFSIPSRTRVDTVTNRLSMYSFKLKNKQWKINK